MRTASLSLSISFLLSPSFKRGSSISHRSNLPDFSENFSLFYRITEMEGRAKIFEVSLPINLGFITRDWNRSNYSRHKAATSLLHIPSLPFDSARVRRYRSFGFPCYLAIARVNAILSLSRGSFQVHRIVDIPLKYEGTHGRYASGCVSTTRNYRGNWHCTPMHRFPEREKPTEKRTFFCFVMGAHSPPIFLVWEFSDVENPGSIYGRFFF